MDKADFQRFFPTFEGKGRDLEPRQTHVRTIWLGGKK